MEELKLIEAAKEGDRAALSVLVKKYSNTVYNFAYKICRDQEKAKNTVQETFLSMVKSISQFNSQAKLSTWLYRIVANHCMMAARKRKDVQFVEVETEESLFDDKYIVDWSTLPIKQLENNELREILDSAINKLTPEYRMVFTLRDVEQLSIEETSKITGLSVSAIKSRLHRARAFLRKELTKEFVK